MTENKELLPFSDIEAATRGEAEAMERVLKHYEGYIRYLSTRKLRREYGSGYSGVDQDIYDRLKAKLIRAVLDFEV